MGTAVVDLARFAADVAEDKKAKDVIVLDIRGLSVIADYFVICSGGSNIQVQAIAKAIRDKVEERHIPLRGMEGYDDAKWVLLDFGDVVVHVFREEDRQFYNLERLWGDAPQLNASPH